MSTTCGKNKNADELTGAPPAPQPADSLRSSSGPLVSLPATQRTGQHTPQRDQKTKGIPRIQPKAAETRTQNRMICAAIRARRRNSQPLRFGDPAPGAAVPPSHAVVCAAHCLRCDIRRSARFGRGDVLCSAAARNRRFCGGIPSCPGAAIWSAGGSRSRRGGRGRAGDLGPCRPGPTPAEPPRGRANVKIAQGNGNPEGNRGGTGTGQRPKGTNRRTPDEGKPEEGGRRGGTRRATGKPEESPQGKPEAVR